MSRGHRKTIHRMKDESRKLEIIPKYLFVCVRDPTSFMVPLQGMHTSQGMEKMLWGSEYLAVVDATT